MKAQTSRIVSFALALVAGSWTAQLFAAGPVPDSLNAADWSSIRALYDQQRHAASPVAGGHQARNPGQQWLTRFDGRGFLTRPDAGGWQWGLELQSYGFTGHERTLTAPPQVSASGQRVIYDWDPTLQEWFINDRRGLEHGFTIRERPPDGAPARSAGFPTCCIADFQVGSGWGFGWLAGWETRDTADLEVCATTDGTPAGPSLNLQPSTLNLLLAVRGGLRPEVEADGRAVRFVDAQGVAALTYSGLTVRDADGRTLPARFEPVPDRAGCPQPAANAAAVEPVGRRAENCAPYQKCKLRLAIDERGARYPLTIDPIAQQAYLKASNTGANDIFGWLGGGVGRHGGGRGAYEDSSATGVNGNQSDNSAADCRRGLRLRAQRDDLEPAGLSQSLQHRGG